MEDMPVIEMTDRGNQYTSTDVVSPKVLDFYTKYKEKEAGMPHVVSEVICIKCGKRWISVRPEKVLLKELECPNCGQIESVIETGQPIVEE